MMLEIQVLAWDMHTKVAGLNWLIGSQNYIICYLKFTLTWFTIYIQNLYDIYFLTVT